MVPLPCRTFIPYELWKMYCNIVKKAYEQLMDSNCGLAVAINSVVLSIVCDAVCKLVLTTAAVLHINSLALKKSDSISKYYTTSKDLI